MPFTFSHPAIILPFVFNKKYFSVSGLIIGSMIPDFEYFIRMRVSAEYGHSLFGVFWFDLPLSIFFLFLFHNIIKNDLIDNLPKFFNVRFNKYKNLNWNRYLKKNWIKVCSSIIVGTLSHLLWDGFTHYNGYFVESIPYLKDNIKVLITTIPIYNFLQHLSTIFGGLVILLFINKMPKNNFKHSNSIKIYYWGLTVFLTTVIVILRFKDGVNFKYYGNIIVSLISAFLLSVTLTPIVLRSIKKSYK